MKSETANCLASIVSFLPRHVLAKSVIVLLSFSSLAFLAGCSSSRPSDSQARKVVEDTCEGLVKRGAKFVDFRKQNAESREEDGQKIYEYYFLAAFELPAGYAWDGGNIANDVRGVPHFSDYTPLPKGALFVSKGRIAFRLTEKGWLHSGVVDSATYAYCTDLGPKDCYQKLGWNKLE
jgi:hypothetical protein